MLIQFNSLTVLSTHDKCLEIDHFKFIFLFLLFIPKTKIQGISLSFLRKFSFTASNPCLLALRLLLYYYYYITIELYASRTNYKNHNSSIFWENRPRVLMTHVALVDVSIFLVQSNVHSNENAPPTNIIAVT